MYIDKIILDKISYLVGQKEETPDKYFLIFSKAVYFNVRYLSHILLPFLLLEENWGEKILIRMGTIGSLALQMRRLRPKEIQDYT